MQMDNDTYLIPANTKSGALIFNAFTWFDLILFGSGIFVSLILLIALPIEELAMALIALSPALICAFLVIPIPNYHNVLTVLKSAISFFTERRIFIWKGWCVASGKEEK
jgi:hypothetical protein